MVISDLLHKNHISPICSKSGIVALIIIFTALALPLLVVRMTHSKSQIISGYFVYRLLDRHNHLLRAAQYQALKWNYGIYVHRWWSFFLWFHQKSERLDRRLFWRIHKNLSIIHSYKPRYQQGWDCWSDWTQIYSEHWWVQNQKYCYNPVHCV